MKKEKHTMKYTIPTAELLPICLTDILTESTLLGQDSGTGDSKNFLDLIQF